MNKINIPFRGMTNVPDDSFSQDGSMSVLLNMRHKGGELVQCQPPTKDATVMVKQVLYHAQSGQWLTLNNRGQITIGGETVTGVTSFALMGNIVVLYKERSVEYAIWRNGAYVYLGPLPEVPMLTATELGEITKKRTTEEKYYQKFSKGNKELWYRNVQKGFVDEILDSIYNECGYVDRALFRVGLRLFDGSYISLSGIYQLSARRTGDDDTIGIQDLFTPKGGTSEDPCQFLAQVYYFKPKLGISEFDTNWKDVISSIDVFSTGSIMTNVVARESGERTGVYDNSSGEVIAVMTDPYEWYRPRSAEELKEAIVNAQYYKVAEFDLDGNEMWRVDNTSPSVLANQTQLPEIQYHGYVAKSTQVYNARLHAVANKTIFFSGFNPSYKYDGMGGTPRTDEEWTVVVYIDTDAGERRVVLKESSADKALLYYFVYPDSRAKRMEIFGYKNGMGNAKMVIPLTAHRFRNEAYCLGVEQKIVYKDDKLYNIPYIKTDYGWTALTTEGIPGSYEYYERPGILKVSAVDNPFYFPTAQTYKFEGDIVGLASNAEAISTGQFGQYPLFVFTTEGIWAMAVDASGQGAYVSQSPFSREVCSGAVCPVSGGIVFTTQRGVMAISGGQVTELSQPLDGLENLMLAETQLFDLVFNKAGKQLISPVQIREYLKPVGTYKTKLAYNYLHNEVILSNAKRGYSYVYSLTNQEWSMIDVAFDITTNSYPELVVYDNNTVRRITFNDGNEANAVVAITRPVKVDTLDFKRLRQAALRCTFEGSLNFYVLGSNDGARFVCITGKECPTKSEVDSGITSVSTQRDLITSMSRSKQYKYIAIAVAGNMKGRISLAEMLVEGGFASNQLR